LRVSGDVVSVEDVLEEGDMERMEREGEKAVRRRRSGVEVAEERSGVKDWKRFGRVWEGMVVVCVACTSKLIV
jgi:hypothetical protein